MARRRKVDSRVRSSVLPTEFFDPESKHWASVEATRSWLRQEGLLVGGESRWTVWRDDLRCGPLTRRAVAVNCWRSVWSDSDVWAELRAAGVGLDRNSSDAVMEVFKFHGIRVEGGGEL